MVHAQRATAEEGFRLIPPVLADAASRYQRAREVEREQLALMARHNLLEAWSDDVTATVLKARERIHDARAAREHFRAQIRELVHSLRAARDPLAAVLRHTRSTIQLLESSGAIVHDGGWLEAEILEWAIEDYDLAG